MFTADQQEETRHARAGGMHTEINAGMGSIRARGRFHNENTRATYMEGLAGRNVAMELRRIRGSLPEDEKAEFATLRETGHRCA